MRGVSDEGKVISPMFPRLHVNDTEKGGPRPPPRNKMALYEQLSIPSQRLSSGSGSVMPLLPNNGSSLVPSMSSGHGGGCERNVYTPFYNPALSHSGEKLFCHAKSRVKLSTTMVSRERKFLNSDDQSSNTKQPVSASAKSNTFQSHNFLNFKNFSCKKLRDESDCRVPSSTQSIAAVHRTDSQQSKVREHQPHLNKSFSMQFQISSENQKKGTCTINTKTREYTRNQAEDGGKVSQRSQDAVERSASVPSNKEKAFDASAIPSGKVKTTESLKRAHPSSNKDYSSNSGDALKSLHGANAKLNQEFVAPQDKVVLRDKLLVEPAGFLCMENGSKVENKSYSRQPMRDENRNPSRLENGSSYPDDESESFQVRVVQRCDDMSDTSMEDSMSTVKIMPDDVIRAIGQRQFWKARTAIVNQQRVFAVQIFELHRLIKVQQLMAGSPHLLLEDNLYIGKGSLNISPVKKYALEQAPVVLKPKDCSRGPDFGSELADENVVGKLPLPSVNNEASKGLPTQWSNNLSHSGSAPPTPVVANTKPSQLCFPPPGNQWLVPVMSPSEGLVYKPYTGPCPPTAGFVAPIYGSCGPMSLYPGSGNFLNAAYGVPASHQQEVGILPGNHPLGQTYFPPYGMAVINRPISGSAVEQMTPFNGHQPKDNQLSVGDFTIFHQSSCNMSSQMSRVISCCVGKFQAPKESELQGSTASSPSERAKGDALPLFPTEPTVQASDHQNDQTDEHQTRVIKVVPLNPRSASESAARIFQSIQEERKQCD